MVEQKNETANGQHLKQPLRWSPFKNGNEYFAPSKKEL